MKHIQTVIEACWEKEYHSRSEAGRMDMLQSLRLYGGDISTEEWIDELPLMNPCEGEIDWDAFEDYLLSQSWM